MIVGKGQSLGGAVDVSTVLGSGSTFTVYLPWSGEAAEHSAEVTPELPRGRHQQVLVDALAHALALALRETQPDGKPGAQARPADQRTEAARRTPSRAKRP